MTRTDEIKYLLGRLTELLTEGKPTPASKPKSYSRSDLYSLVDVARELKVGARILRRDIDAGRIDAPRHMLPDGRRCYYDDTDLDKIKAAFVTRPLVKGQGSAAVTNARRAAGLYSITEVAESAGLSRCSIEHHIKMGRLNPPSHPHGSRIGLYYTGTEYRASVAWLDKWRDHYGVHPGGRPALPKHMRKPTVKKNDRTTLS